MVLDTVQCDLINCIKNPARNSMRWPGLKRIVCSVQEVAVSTFDEKLIPCELQIYPHHVNGVMIPSLLSSDSARSSQ